MRQRQARRPVPGTDAVKGSPSFELSSVSPGAAAPAPERKSDSSAERFYRPELDVLRFFAFFGVFIFHAAPHTRDFYDAAGAPHWLSSFLISVFGAGAYGVDLFFALSAYLITSLLLRERDLIWESRSARILSTPHPSHMAAVSGVCGIGGDCRLDISYPVPWRRLHIGIYFSGRELGLCISRTPTFLCYPVVDGLH